MRNQNALPRRFYIKDTIEIARELLGKELIHNTIEGITSGIIVETEAYIGPHDRASHAYKGKRTERTSIQYEEGGKAYIYKIYGLHYCFNVVTQIKEKPEVVLIRALKPLKGIEIMKKRRKLKNGKIIELTNGPGKLCQALAIDKNCYGLDLCEGKLFISNPKKEGNTYNISSSKRINIDYAGDAKYYPWRFFLRNNPYVSVKEKDINI